MKVLFKTPMDVIFPSYHVEK